MPYIKQEDRKALDESINKLIEDAVGVGEANYVITKFLNGMLLTKRGGPAYHRINEVIGVLECAKMEFYSRIAVPYEHEKMIENGDVYT